MCTGSTVRAAHVLGTDEHLHLGFRVLHSCNYLLRKLSDVLCLGILKNSQITFNTLRMQKSSSTFISKQNVMKHKKWRSSALGT